MMSVIHNILEKVSAFIHAFGPSATEDDGSTRRRHIRRAGPNTDILVANSSYIVKDWSKGGVFFETQPDARMVLGDQVQLTLRFRLPNEIITITQPGRIVRAVKRGIAAEFLPLSNEARRLFDRVIDGMNAQGFIESQAA